MNLIPTAENRNLAGAIGNKIAAENFYIAGRSRFWRLTGFGLILFGLGAATGLGFFGYSYIRRSSDTFATLSAALSKALPEVRFRATANGTVQIEPREIALAQNQTISLDPSSRLHLDPSAKVLADGEITIQGPSVSVPQTMTQRPTPSTPIIVNFTVFKSVPFEKGTVQTGWTFLTSAQKSPTQQYCYYTEALDTPGRNVMLDIGTDGKLETPKTLTNSFDVATAFTKCVWFKNEGP